MVDFLFSIDTSIFYFFNHTLSNKVFDVFFCTITTSRNWMYVYILFAFWLIYKKKRLGGFILLSALVLVLVTDMIGFRILKEYFTRPRPFKTLPDVLLPNGPTGTYSFPSNHAMNNFAQAVFFSAIFPKAKYWLFTTASLVAISRVYVGVHYPSDIVGGAVIGSFFGCMFVLLYRKLYPTVERFF